MQVSAQILPLLSALKHLATVIEGLEAKMDDMQAQIEAMQTEWRTEYEVDDAWESETEESDSVSESESDESCYSAPATFSYKVQRVS